MKRINHEGHEGHEEGNMEIRKAGRGEGTLNVQRSTLNAHRETGIALPFGADEAEVAEGISQGWRRAQAGLVEVLRFGAMCC